ncbi:MAG: hypothetical protein PHF63_11320 [Herbinix sp.]|nr:hypothetical protein [Herbinix sp.]
MVNDINSGKLENVLKLALDIPEITRDKTYNLDDGYIPVTNTWELIVKYMVVWNELHKSLEYPL